MHAGHDVVIAGASFAGLMLARELRDHSVLIVDRHPVGTHQTSACGAPLDVLTALGLEDAVEQVHDTLYLHVGGRRVAHRLPFAFCTFDYEAFCRGLLAQAKPDLLRATVTGRGEGALLTDHGPRYADQLVDAAGFRRILGRGGPRPLRAADGISYGIETPAPGTDEGLHFWVGDGSQVGDGPGGYGWAFPARDADPSAVRAGVLAYAPKRPLKAPLGRFLDAEGYERRTLHGGHIPHRLRPPIDDGVVFVGDSAGQVLPATAEGIRPALVFARLAGRHLARALDQTRDKPPEARARALAAARAAYAADVAGRARHFRRMLAAQGVLSQVPDPLLGAAARVISRPRVFAPLMRRYRRMVPPDLLDG